jgi:catalase
VSTTAPDPVARDLAARVVDAMNAIGGRHSGHRAGHAKGTLCAGTFVANPQVASLTRAAHMSGAPVRAHVRFSNASGDPGAPDGGPEGQGMAVKLYLPDGSTTDVVAVPLPVFMVSTPEDFLEFLRARSPDPETGEPDMERLGAFFAAHPESLPAIQHALSAGPPASYLRRRYNALHAFRLVDAAGNGRFARISWVPEEGEATVEASHADGLPANYLQDELAERLGRGPGAFMLTAQLAAPGDPTDDATVAWPEDREQVTLGRLEITGIASDRERDGDVLVFDPTRLTDGIECSDDPLLRFRSEAYAESVLRRSGVRRPADA